MTSGSSYATVSEVLWFDWACKLLRYDSSWVDPKAYAIFLEHDFRAFRSSSAFISRLLFRWHISPMSPTPIAALCLDGNVASLNTPVYLLVSL
jgi:hypothetical protein